MKTNNRIKARLTFFLFVMTLSLAGLGGRVYYIKTAHGEEYENAAKTQQVMKYDVAIPPNRGTILDRNKQALAVSTTVYNVALDPRVLSGLKAETQEKVLRALSENLEGVDYDTLKGYVAIDPVTQKPALDTNWKYIAYDISREKKEELEALGATKGVAYEKDTLRSYTLNTVACHVLGFIRGDTSWGLEEQYNKELSGAPGRSFITFDGSNNAQTQEYPAQDGDTIVTTLDYTIQQYAEEAVDTAVKDFNPETAAVLVMEPGSGEVLAMASSPNFNNNDPATPLALENDPEFKAKWDAMSDKEKNDYWNTMWKNFNVVSTYEPGSVFKPIVVAAALEENIIKPTDVFYCSGSKQVADYNIPCHLKTGHGNLDIEGILANSCNVGMMDIAEKMGKDMFYKYQTDFGFGQRTGIDLPGEVSSAANMYTPERIGESELATMSFGQSFNCTTIQMASAFSALINGGNLMRPHVVSQILDTKGNVVQENKPELIRKVISQQTSDIVRNMLKGTVEYGTGKKIKIDGYSIGCKTGTAQQGKRSDNIYTLSYMAYFPADNPEYLVMTVIHKPEGGDTASPAAITRTLIENIIKYKNIEPSYPSESGDILAGSSNKKKVTLEDYTDENMYVVAAELEAKNLEYKIVGKGNTVFNQAPHGGTEVEEGSEIILYVKKGEGDTGNITVPDVKGLSYEDAVAKINDSGLTTVTDGDKEGVVASQDPKAGITVEEETEVKLTFEPAPQEENEE